MISPENMPQLIRAAEGIREWCSEDGKSDEMYDPIIDAQTLADAILEQSADYTETGLPLAVDEAFCESLGMKREEDEGGYVWWSVKSATGAEIKWWGDDVEIDCTQVAANMTRPALRALLIALGAGGAT